MREHPEMSLLYIILTTFIVSTVSGFSFFLGNTSCSKTEFSCSNDTCINNTQLCDGFKDCSDGADEINCEYLKCESPDHYKCINNKCISSAFVCDKVNDCLDGSDENHCHDKSLTKPCTEGEFKCSDGSCIPMFWHCDGTVDCDDGSDEDMEKCRVKTLCTEGFLCKNLQCISKTWRCDGKDDCGDNSDETHCDFHLIELEQCLIGNRKFLCHDHKKCIDIEKVCNNNNDCLDASDEGGLCNNMTGYKKDCKTMNCSSEFECLRKPHGIMCVCPKGTRYSNITCLDINECEEHGVCDQLCNNTYGKYTCSCEPDYELVNDHKCKIKGEDPVLVYSSLRQIKVLNLATHKNYILVDKLQQATGLAVDGTNIYWTIIYEGMQAIVRANKNDTKPEIIVTSGLGTPENLAIDSITRNLYFTDAKMKHIGVCNNDGSVCTVLHNKDIDKPRAIAVSPMDGFMYWTDWGESPMIARSGMDGSLPQKFVTQDIHWPNGVHVDYPGKRIYWVDAKMQIIESVKLDASDRRVIVTQSVDHPFSVTVFEDKLYWSDWSGKEIKMCNKFTGKDRKSLVRESKSRVYGMQVFHPSLFKSQSLSNPCEKAKCSDMCLLAPKKNSNSKKYSCACPDDKRLSPDGLFCYDMTISPILIVGASTSILEIEQEHLGRLKIKEIPLKNKLSIISAMTYNSLSGNIIIYDSSLKKLFAYDLVKMKLSDLVTSEIGSLHSLKFDSFGNNLYWCDLNRGTLEVFSFSTNSRTIIMSQLNNHIPIAVTLVPDEGFMFVVMKDGYRARIDRINMDGNINSRVHIIELGLMEYEIVLHFELFTRRLYFTDLKNGVIYSVNENGFDRKLAKNSGFVIDMVSMENEIFWVSRGSRILYWMDMNNNHRSSRVLDMESWKRDSNLCLSLANGVNKDVQHPCQRNNGGCSHVCLLSGKEKVCSCSPGFVLSNNGLECILPKQCKLNEYRCSTGECILSIFRCDSKQDCPHGDDEDIIKCSHFPPNMCPKSQFLCHDKSKCLDKKLLCNNVIDCSDGSDEEDCGPKHTCDPNTEFLCSTGECIQLNFLCDGNSDCMNGQDEFNCQNHTCHHLEFRCESGTCIAAAWECDGELDCVDASDEHDSCVMKKCKADQFSCNNGHCIPHKFTCNGKDDCDDNSDENGCPMFQTKPTKRCNEDKEFECENTFGHCVPIEARCNGTSECKRFEDELNCGCQKPDIFECNNKRCVPKEWLCDKIDDCGDRSDESSKACDVTFQQSQIVMASMSTGCDGYLCKNKECIPMDRVCNKKVDCKDGTDEGDLCGVSCQFMNNCSQICQETPKGGKCMCYRGYKIAPDGMMCKDIDECEDKNICTQYCLNLDGSYSCNCLNSDYMLRADKMSCKALGPPMDLIYSDTNQVRSISGDLKETKLLFSESVIPVTDLDLDIRRNLIYWTSEDAGTLICMNKQQEHKVYMKDLVNPTLVRVDWLTENVYFVENHCDIIVCNLNEKRCATIYSANVHVKIKAFAIDPLSGLMFWSESIWAIWTSPTTIIRQSDCSGHSVKTIIDQGLHDITDIAIDPIKRMVYWVDIVNATIERSNYDGSNRNMLLYTNHFPKKISLYEDKLFWTNDATGYSIFKCKIFDTVNVQCESVPIQIYTPINIFMISQQAKQINASNVCMHVQCEFICTSGSKGPMCVCEDGSQVEPDAICNDVGHRKLPNFKQVDSSNVSIFVALSIIVMLGLMMIYYYLYHYKKKPFVILPGFHFHNPLSTITEVTNKRENIQHVQLVPGHHAYENPINQTGLIKDYVECDVELCYNDTQSVYDSGSESRRTSSSVTDYEDQKKKLIIL